MLIHRKPEVENFRESNTFFLCIQKKVIIRGNQFYGLEQTTYERKKKKILNLSENQIVNIKGLVCIEMTDKETTLRCL